jgi:uroporphyrinogen III methyltransferase/synthase
VVVTEADGSGGRLASALEAAGLRVWSMPVVAHEPAPDPGPLVTELARLADFDWVTFSSVRAVTAVCDYPEWTKWPWASAKRPRVAAVGPLTHRCLMEHQVPVAVCPAQAGAAGLVRALIEAEGCTIAGRTVLWPRSDIARPDLRDLLVAAQARVVDPVAYCTRAVRSAGLTDFLNHLRAGRVDAVTFLSPSSAVNLAAAMEDGTLSVLAGRTIVASVGPTTSATLIQLGAAPAVEARDRTAHGLAAALLSRFDSDRGPASVDGGRVASVVELGVVRPRVARRDT